MRSLAGRQKVLQLFINLTRWLHTIHILSLLPPPPPARLMKTFFRPSPYNGECVSPALCWSFATFGAAVKSAIGVILSLCLQSTAMGSSMVQFSCCYISIPLKRHFKSLGSMCKSCWMCTACCTLSSFLARYNVQACM